MRNFFLLVSASLLLFGCSEQLTSGHWPQSTKDGTTTGTIVWYVDNPGRVVEFVDSGSLKEPTATVIRYEKRTRIEMTCPDCSFCTRIEAGLWVVTAYGNENFVPCPEEIESVIEYDEAIETKMPLSEAKKLAKEHPELVDFFYVE